MKKSFICKFIAIFVAALLVIVPILPGTVAALTKMTDAIITIFDPIPPEKFHGDFTVYVNVEYPAGEGELHSGKFSFDMLVDLGADYAGKTLETSMGRLTADENGVLHAKCAPNSLLGIKGVVEGTEITVTHVIQGLKGFTSKDGITQRSLIYAENNNTLSFVCIYAPEALVLSDAITLIGDKDLSNIDWEKGDKFEFLLEYKDGDKWVSIGVVELEYSEYSDGEFDLGDIIKDVKIDTIGEHQFRLSEIRGDLDHGYYDPSYKYFDLIIEDADMDGALELSGFRGHGDVSVNKNSETGKSDILVSFLNTADPTPPEELTVTITVNNNLDDKSKDGANPEDYKFILENVVTGDKYILQSDADGKAKLELTFTPDDVGKTFQYRLYQSKDVEGAEYSDKVYEITVGISLNEKGELVATYTCDGGPCDEIIAEFITVYDPPAQFYSWPLIFTGAMAAAVGAAWPGTTYSLRAIRKKKGII